MSEKPTTALDKKLFADLQLTDEVLGNDYAADGETVIATCRIPIGELMRKGIVSLDAPLATVNSANTISVAGPIFGKTTDDQLVIKWGQTASPDGWTTPFATTEQGDAADTHIGRTDNPHGVSAAQVGLGNVDDTSDADKPVSTAAQSALDLKATLEHAARHATGGPDALSPADIGAATAAQGDAADAHIGRTDNPHSVSAAQVGLGNVNNTADAAKPVSSAQRAAINRRAFAGGVATVQGGYSRMPSGFDSSTRALTLYWRGIIHRFGASDRWCLLGNVRGTYNENPYGIAINLASNGAAALFYAAAGGSVNGTGTGGAIFVPLDVPVEIIGTVSSEGVMQLSIIGVGDGNPATIPDYSNGITEDDLFLHAGFTAGNTINTSFAGDATCNEYGFFNRALSPTEASELSQIGIGAWLAKYPQDKWGEAIPSDLTVGWSSIANGSIVSSNSYEVVGGVGGVVYTTQLGKRYSYRFRISEKTGTIDFRNSTINTIISNLSAGVTYEGSFIDTGNNQSQGIYFRSPNDASATFEFLDVKQDGALAAYQMDEGIGRQPRDLSGRYDALLSATGYEHLQPKTEGKVRVKAANASSAIYMLEASDIIPADAVITDIISEERKVAVANTAQDLADNRIRLNPSGSDLQIQRSDGTNHDTLGTVTAPASLDDIDAEVHYKKQAR